MVEQAETSVQPLAIGTSQMGFGQRAARALGRTLAGMVLVAAASSAQQEQSGSGAAPPDMAEMMAKMQQYTAPGKAHELLEGFVGVWDTATRITMAGASGDPARGRSEFRWLMPDRWLEQRASSSLMGTPFESYSIMGYDNFKMSYVATSVSSIDTAMHRAEGDLDSGGKVLILYGTLDEYLTGEHDKMVKTVWRLDFPDRMIMEVHDLPIGEKNTKVIEVVYTRQKANSRS